MNLMSSTAFISVNPEFISDIRTQAGLILDNPVLYCIVSELRKMGGNGKLSTNMTHC